MLLFTGCCLYLPPLITAGVVLPPTGVHHLPRWHGRLVPRGRPHPPHIEGGAGHRVEHRVRGCQGVVAAGVVRQVPGNVVIARHRHEDHLRRGGPGTPTSPIGAVHDALHEPVGSRCNRAAVHVHDDAVRGGPVTTRYDALGVFFFPYYCIGWSWAISTAEVSRCGVTLVVAAVDSFPFDGGRGLQVHRRRMQGVAVAVVAHGLLLQLLLSYSGGGG